jgi:hypothetical protein
VDQEQGLELGEWEPHDISSVPERMRPTLELLNRFGEAFYSGRIPTGSWRSTGPDYAAQQVVLTIFPEDAAFREAVAAVLPADSYRIVVDDVHGIG